MSTCDTFIERHPVAADRVVVAATVGVLLLPAAIILAILSGHQMILAQAAALASAGSYAVGYTAAAIRYRRRCREAVAEARRDPLTGLPNRAVADAMLTAATANRTRMTVALIDVDGLHAVNASLGHAAGDQYLTTITTRLAAAVPANGCLVRQGGDEFTLLAPGTDPTVLATAIGAALAGRATIAGHHMQPRASVGIADSGGPGARFDAGHARGCADAALYSAKAAGGNRILIYNPDRDGTPEPDGSRPLLRRRDIDPLAEDGVAWLPSPSRELVPLLLRVADLRTLHHVLGVAADRWAQTAAEAHAGAHRPNTPAPPAGDSINVEPTPGGYRSIAHLAQQQATSYAQLAQRLAPIIEATAHLDDPGTSPAHGPDLAAAVLVGISAAFTPDELEGLVITAAEAVHGRLDELSGRQWELAARAHTLLHDADD